MPPRPTSASSLALLPPRPATASGLTTSSKRPRQQTLSRSQSAQVLPKPTIPARRPHSAAQRQQQRHPHSGPPHLPGSHDFRWRQQTAVVVDPASRVHGSSPRLAFAEPTSSSLPPPPPPPPPLPRLPPPPPSLPSELAATLAPILRSLPPQVAVPHPQASLVRRAGRDSGWAKLKEHELTELAGRYTLASVGWRALRTKALVHALRGARIFGSMGETQLSIMASGGRRRRLPRYASLCREGGRAESFFVLERGTLELSKLSGERRFVSCAEGGRGVVLGTEGLSGRPRLESGCAAEACELVEFATSSLKISETGALALSALVFEAFVEAELRAMRLFRGLPARVLQSCVPLFSMACRGAGEAIFEEEAPGSAFYVLTQGRVEVHKGGQTVALLDAADGEERGSDGHADGHPFFGEMALLDGKPRMAGVRSVSPCTLLVLGRAQFKLFLQRVPDFKPRLRRIKELRKKQTEINLVT